MILRDILHKVTEREHLLRLRRDGKGWDMIKKKLDEYLLNGWVHLSCVTSTHSTSTP